MAQATCVVCSVLSLICNICWYIFCFCLWNKITLMKSLILHTVCVSFLIREKMNSKGNTIKYMHWQMTPVLTLILSMPASTRSWSTSFCAWITLLLLLPVFPDMLFKLKEVPAITESFFEWETASERCVLPGCAGIHPVHETLVVRGAPDPLTCMQLYVFVSFSHGVGSKALWCWRSHSSWSKCHKPHTLIRRHGLWIDYRLCKTFTFGRGQVFQFTTLCDTCLWMIYAKPHVTITVYLV